MSNLDFFDESADHVDEIAQPSRGGGFMESPPVRLLRRIWDNTHMWRVATLATIVAVALLFTWTQGPIAQHANTDPVINGYVALSNIE
jgi:anti-sigma-K factor RskA